MKRKQKQPRFKPTDTLLSICQSEFFPLNIRMTDENTRYQYRLAFRDYGKFLEREPRLSDLDDDQITRWMAKAIHDGALKAITIRERAGRIQTLWTWLAKRRVVEEFPTFVKPQPAESHPYALSVEQLSALFESAARERGRIATVPASLWWLSFLGFIWNTAERKTAVLSVRPEWLSLDDPECGKAVIPPEVRKGRKKYGIYDLWPETVLLLRSCIAVDPHRSRVWEFPYSPQSYYSRYNRILRDAGIPVNRKTKTHSLRVSHATWRTVAGGDATRQLGHSDPATTTKSYIDPTKLPRDNVKMQIPWLAMKPRHEAVEQAVAQAHEVVGIDESLGWM